MRIPATSGHGLNRNDMFFDNGERKVKQNKGYWVRGWQCNRVMSI